MKIFLAIVSLLVSSVCALQDAEPGLLRSKKKKAEEKHVAFCQCSQEDLHRKCETVTLPTQTAKRQVEEHKGQYGPCPVSEGIDLNPATARNLEDNCFEQYPDLEPLTGPEWYENTKSIQNERYSWFRLRQKFEPIAGESTVIAGVLYTHSNSTLKLTVFFPPLHPEEERSATLRVTTKDSGNQQTYLQTCEIKETTWHCTFRVDPLPSTVDYVYRVDYQPSPDLTYSYDGVIPKQVSYPRIAAMGCFGPDSTWNKDKLVEAVLAENPDMLVLQGDQTYMMELAYGFLELLYSINNLTRSIPTLVQMDDHDYGLPNLWGAGDAGEDSGEGFGARPVCAINAIEDMALGHLPDPATDNTLDDGITIRFTNYVYGNVDFAILEARKFKNYKGGDSLLGDEQEEWLKGWCHDENVESLKVVLAQTPFAALGTNATLYSQNSRIAPILYPSLDTNAYPTEGRSRFMEIAKDCSPLVLSGDQHLGIAVTYDEFGVSECASPAVINDVFWRLNVNPVGESHVDAFGDQYTLHQAWNVDEAFWTTTSPYETTYTDDGIKDRRGDGFMMVTVDGETADCEMHSYRVDPQLVWTVNVPASTRSRR